MSALAFDGTVFDYSFNYDTFTIYPKTSHQGMPIKFTAACQKQIDYLLDDCHKHFPNLLQPKEVSSDNYKYFRKSVIKLSTHDRFIHGDDWDHEFYHLDNFNRDRAHIHIKFIRPLNSEILNNIFDLLIKHSAACVEEKIEFLNKLSERFSEAEKKFNAQLIFVKQKDKASILDFIKTCDDNDILNHLHHYLSTPQFNYLRESPKISKVRYWQARQEDGRLTETTKTWAKIEEAFALKLGKNFISHCLFDKYVADERRVQFSTYHSFFGINHNALEHTAGSIIENFTDDNIIEFTNEYNNVFK